VITAAGNDDTAGGILQIIGVALVGASVVDTRRRLGIESSIAQAARWLLSLLHRPRADRRQGESVPVTATSGVSAGGHRTPPPDEEMGALCEVAGPTGCTDRFDLPAAARDTQ
jgi:hypothetical protein